MAGDFDGNGRVDLAVGATRDDPIGVTADNSGSVFAFYSDATGLQLNLNQNCTPATSAEGRARR